MATIRILTMNGEEMYLIGELNGCLTELKALINTKNEGKRRAHVRSAPTTVTESCSRRSPVFG
ncbi:hypothetical protein SMRU11_29435 [Sinorhizobium meliloti RU11/001]|nr:hypothetical protein SMRU11_29435 [Sinorhizobium meliloti RU11/001]